LRAVARLALLVGWSLAFVWVVVRVRVVVAVALAEPLTWVSSSWG
jgi:hypothetical protein